jgi:hypothetical protein
MAGFASLNSSEIKQVITSIGTLDKGLMSAWKAEARDKVVVPWAAELALQAPPGSKGAAAGSSIKPASTGVPSLYAGKGKWDGWQPFFALEYGMAHEKYHTYVRTSPKGKRHVVRRRTGRWAPVHRGRSGYWMWPYWEAHQDKLRDRVVNLADAFIRRSL